VPERSPEDSSGDQNGWQTQIIPKSPPGSRSTENEQWWEPAYIPDRLRFLQSISAWVRVEYFESGKGWGPYCRLVNFVPDSLVPYPTTYAFTI
jgi:hypothetical protein